MFALRPAAVAVVLVAALTTACGEPPEKEMNQAQGAIDAARAAGADQFAVDEYDAARKALDRSREAVDQRDYRQALSLALDAREHAQTAARAAADGKARARSETDRTLHVAELALDRAHDALAKADAAKVTRATLATSIATLDTADGAIREARAAIERDDFVLARTRLDGVANRIDVATSEIDAAAAAPPARKPVRRTSR